ncbi:MAG: M4 family metallopeptidase [Deltaproteobacteria bacterium]|nr:M4 family metallopeptidase [Deltaproteobacteria bacterium]
MIFARHQLMSGSLVAIVFMYSVATGLAATSDIQTHINNLEQSEGIKADFNIHPKSGAVRMLKSGDGKSVYKNVQTGATPESASRAFVSRHGKIFGIGSDKEYLTRKINRDKNGNSYVRFQQHQLGLPVIAGEFVVHSDRSHNVMNVLGKTSLKLPAASTPSFSSTAALEAALRATAKYHDAEAGTLTGSRPVLSVYNPSLLNSLAENTSTLVWQIEVKSRALAPIRQFVLVNAATGAIELSFNQIHRIKDRVVYDKSNIRGEIDPNNPATRGVLQRSEGGIASNIPDVEHAYQYSGDTYDYYFTMFTRDGIDGSGMQIVNSVRYCSTDLSEPCPYQNAFWDGQQMVYGEGYPAAPDVVAHELTHGITDRTSGLFYYMQSGAINESFSDLWGEFVQQKYHPSPDADKWLIGENLRGIGGPFRSMKDPGSYGDPDRMSSALYACGSGTATSDNGGVHYNSGINNKAVYLMTDGGSFNGKTVTGLGADKVSRLYFYVQTNLLTSGSDYADLYNALQMGCSTLVGTDGITQSDCQQVINALDAVEMNQPAANCSAPEAPVCAANEIPVNLLFDDFENGLTNWVTTTDSATATTVWTIDSQYAKPGANNTSNSLYGKDIDTKSDTYAALAAAIVLPANAYLHFDHAYEFEYSSDTGEVYDGGVVEYSLDDGSTWLDAGSLVTHNGYSNKTIYNDPVIGDNVLAGKRAFSAISNGYISSRLNLASLSGKSARFRFRIATDSGNAAFTPPEYPFGWVIDNFRLYTCQSTLPGAPIIGTAIAGNRQATVNFFAPLSDGGSTISGYTATSSPGGLTGTGTASPITVIGLTNGIAYTFTVTATNQAGTGAPSAASNSVIPPIIPGDCDFNGTVTIAEVQGAINMFLGLKGVEECVDIDKNGNVSISEVQKVINRFLGH